MNYNWKDTFKREGVRLSCATHGQALRAHTYGQDRTDFLRTYVRLKELSSLSQLRFRRNSDSDEENRGGG